MGPGLVAFTLIHVVISLVGIGSGIAVVLGMISARASVKWTAWFLSSTLLTCVTGFLFPFHKFLPSHAVGILSLIALSIAIFAQYGRQLTGAWRRTYAASATSALYFNVFVLVAQSFQKIPMLKAMAPTQSEAPFKAAQLVLLALFVFIAIFAGIRFQPKRSLTAIP